ncbi:MAG: YbjQ family protein [Acidimicrobiales bacterium]
MADDSRGIYAVEPGGANLPVTTALEFAEWEIDRYVGLCFGLVVRSMGAVKGIGAAFKSIKGGEVTQYTELLEDSRRHALDRMVENARLMGANAVISMRFDSSEMGESLTEIVAYGTGVVLGQRR